MSKYTRLLRFTVILIFIIFFISHKLITKKQYQHVLALQAQLSNTKYDINGDMRTAQNTHQGEGKVVYKDTGDLKQHNRANATLFSLARNDDLLDMAKTVRSVEDRFNHKFHYDWVFFNNEEFDQKFQRQMINLCSGNVKFEVVPKEFWSYPDWIDQDHAKRVRIDSHTKLIYGGSEAYRFMCRFFSGFYYKLDSLKKYDYAWRVEPQTTLHCDVNYDVFNFMLQNDKHYGFTISLREFEEAIPTLWTHVKKFIELYPQYINPNNLLDFISSDNGHTYNLCHFWTNFEIVDLNFLRSEAYETFFRYLDQANGFFYERWGDAPVHSIAVALFLDKDQIHYFNDIGYYHKPASNCPIDDNIWKENNCFCDQDFDVTFRPFSCTPKFYDLLRLEKPEAWKEHAMKAVEPQ